MANLAQQSIGIGGLTPAYVAASAGGDSVQPNDRGFLHVKNGAGAPVTVTIAVPGKEYGVDRADVAVAVAAGADVMIGPMPSDLADPATHRVMITYSAAASVTVASLSL